MTMQETHATIKKAISQLKEKQNIAAVEKEALFPAALASAIGAGGAMLDRGTRIVGTGLGYLPAIASTGGILGIGAPVAAGAGTGYLAAKLTHGAGLEAVEEAKQDEIMGEYERLAEEAKRRALLKRVQSQTGRRIVPLSPSLGG